jgi:hypothetical protein
MNTAGGFASDRSRLAQGRGGDLQEVAQQPVPPVRENGQTGLGAGGVRDGNVREAGAGVGPRDTQREQRDAVPGGDQLERLQA